MLNDFRRLVEEQGARLSLLNKELRITESKREVKEQEMLLLQAVNDFFATQINEKLTNVKYQIESLVNQGLTYVFDEDIKIRIDSSFKNNKTIFSLSIVKGGVVGLADSFGGGVLAVISVLLRVSTIIIGKRERLLILDETLGFLSEVYQAKVSNFLQKICRQLDFVIVLITHQPKMATFADKIYQVESSQNNGVLYKEVVSSSL